MKQIGFMLAILLFISGFCFPGESNFIRDLHLGTLEGGRAEFTASMFEFDTGYLTQKILELEKKSSLQKTGRLLIFGGGLLAVTGSVLFIGSKKFGGICCEKKYRNWGALFVGTGAAMVVGGLIMTNKGKKIEGGLALQVDPHMKEAVLGYRLVF